MSKRSSTTKLNNSRKRSKNAKNLPVSELYEGHSLFNKIMKSCGIKLSNGFVATKIDDEPAFLLKKLSKKLKAHDDYPEVITDFVNGFDEYIDDQHRFVRSLLNTEKAELGELCDSTVKVMLQVKDLQEKIAISVLNKLLDYIESDTTRVEGFGITEENINVPQLIINQFRWLTFFQSSDKIFEKLMEMVYMMPLQSASILISSIPDIIADCDHEKVAVKLKDLLKTSSVLTVVILDAFTSLNCSDTIQQEVVTCAFHCFSNVKVEEIPILLKFILKSLNSGNLVANIRKVVNLLDFNLYENETIKELIAEVLFSSIQYQSGVAEELLSAMEMIDYGEFKTTHFIVCILLCGSTSPAVKKNASNFLKNKLENGSISKSVLELASLKCKKLCEIHFDTILSLSSQLIHGFQESRRNVAFNLLVFLFANLNEFCRQEIIGYLVQGLGSLNSFIVDAVLKIFVELSKNHMEAFHQYSLFIKNIVEYLHQMKIGQVRQVYEVLSHLAFADCKSQVSSLEDDLNILIKKQLSHNSTKFQYIGIIGGIQMFNVLASKIGSSKTLTRCYNNGKNVLKLLNNITSRNPKAKLLYYDEMALLYNGPKPKNSNSEKFYTKLIGILKEDLKEFYADNDDVSATSSNSVLLPIKTMFISSDNEHALKIICPNINLTYLPALAASLYQIDSNCVEFLQASLHTYDVTNFETVNQLQRNEKKLVVDSLLFCYNWIREVINGLAKLNCAEHNSEILRNLHHLVQLKNFIERKFSNMENYLPPEVNFLLVQANSNNLPRKTESAIDTNPTASTQKCNDSSIDNGEQPIKKKLTKKPKAKASILNNLRNVDGQYFREWQTPIFNALNFKLNSPENTQGENLKPDELLLILHDLLLKGKHKLTQYTFGKKAGPGPLQSRNVKRGFEKLDLISEQDFGNIANTIVPFLLDRAEDLSTILDSANEEAEDCILEDSNCITNCFEHIVEILKCIILWRGNHNTEEDTLKCFQVFENRMTNKCSKSLKRSCKKTVDYFSNLGTIAPSLKAGQVISSVLSSLLQVVKEHDVCLTQHQNYSEMEEKVSNKTYELLCKDWITLSAENDIKVNDALQSMLNIYFSHHPEPLKGMAKIIDEALCPLIDNQDKKNKLSSFTKLNVHVVYGSLFKALTDEVVKYPVVKQGSDESAGIDVILQWHEGNELLVVLTRILKKCSGRYMLLAAAKYGKIYVDTFIKSAIPSCEYMFKQKQSNVIEVLKGLQVGTRQLQHLTCHTKKSKDLLLSQHMPHLKMSLETLLFQVKGLLAQHKCTKGFWLGNLKNRDLTGEEILTQETNSEEVDEDESNESYSETY